VTQTDPVLLCRKFDLKGSTVDREASDKEKEKDLPTLKDNDFVKEGMKIYIGEEAKEKLHETLNADVGVSLFFCEVGLLINATGMPACISLPKVLLHPRRCIISRLKTFLCTQSNYQFC
jgi:Phosphatidylinositol-4-phosphate 5-Kinase